MRLKILALLSIAVSALMLSGCGDSHTQMGPEEAHVLGIAKIQKANYSPAGPSTFAISTDDLYTRRNFSGDKATFLWGLVTLTDY